MDGWIDWMTGRLGRGRVIISLLEGKDKRNSKVGGRKVRGGIGCRVSC
jgi:hypothetical protein